MLFLSRLDTTLKGVNSSHGWDHLLFFGKRTSSMCTTIVDNAKRMKMPMDEAAELVSTLPKPNSSSITVNDILDWDKATKKILKETSCYKGIKKRLALESTTSITFQVAIRTSPVSPSDYDCFAYVDFRIAEKLVHHFLDLIQAPAKSFMNAPLNAQQLVPPLFSSSTCSLYPVMTRSSSCGMIEVSVEPSGFVKWDGLGLAVGNACPDALPMVAEFAGSIHTLLKKNNDHAKLLLHAKDMV
ncbi:hypothetical protein O0I10_013304, partial [Lichtheimia ornata]